jgi:hypothetical protein
MKEYTPAPNVAAQLDRSFQYHAPNPDQVQRYPLIREKARKLADLVVKLSPPSREQSLALTKIEEAVMWANAGIARNEGE